MSTWMEISLKEIILSQAKRKTNCKINVEYNFCYKYLQSFIYTFSRLLPHEIRVSLLYYNYRSHIFVFVLPENWVFKSGNMKTLFELN